MFLLPQEAIDFLKSPGGVLLAEDVECWVRWYGHNSWYSAGGTGATKELEWHCNRLFEIFPEFRSLFDFRTKTHAQLYKLHAQKFPRATDLASAAASIGPRFRIQHGHGTYILAGDIGSDFWVNQL